MSDGIIAFHELVMVKAWAESSARGPTVRIAATQVHRARVEHAHPEARIGRQVRQVIDVDPAGAGKARRSSLPLGVSGKLAMWRALDHAIGGIELQELEARAESQRERLEAIRLRAAREALAKA